MNFPEYSTRSMISPPPQHRSSRRMTEIMADRSIRIEVTKAAAISTAMFARKQSWHDSTYGLNAGDEPQEAQEIHWFNSTKANYVIRLASVLSLISVSLNTPETFKKLKEMGVQHVNYATFGVDIAVSLVFTAEAISKMIYNGLTRDPRRSYFRSRWCQFDFFMLIFHWVSVIIQAVEIYDTIVVEDGRILANFKFLSAFRSPRPLILIRFIRSVINFRLPRNRLNTIFKRSSQQIYNVTVFFLFFMALYGILGVQFFGHMDYHCLKITADINNVTIRDFAIPDTYCSPNNDGYKCPSHMKCVRLRLKGSQEGYYGMFNNFAYSIFTVYMAASQEGWVYVMYDCIDSLPSWKAFFYFITLIFFLAWLVKNVFIAVITETFAEIRIQFSSMWGNRQMVSEDGNKQVLTKCEDGTWRLVSVDANVSGGWAPEALQKIPKSTSFQVCAMLLVLANALISASFVHRHNKEDTARKSNIYRSIEIVFTMIFNVECLFKIWCFGWKGYIKRGLHKFESVLAVGTTLNILPGFYETHVFACFQVFRILRLIKASPMLEDFVYKIFGPGRKLGGLVLFTMALLIITSCISLQLFCYVDGLDRFKTFPQALMAMFQILTQEGWTEVVIESMRTTGDTLAPVVAIYFLIYHLFTTLIVLSLFVAVILDNLEMEEELKKIKQLKAQDAQSSLRSKLPLRLRVFTKFPDRPQLVVVRRFPGDFPLPKIRDSFTKQFADDDRDDTEDDKNKDKGRMTIQKHRIRQRRKVRHIGKITLYHGLSTIVERANDSRDLLGDSVGHMPVIGRSATIKPMRDRKKSYHRSNMQGSMKMKQMYEHLKENGDLSRGTSATAENRRQGPGGAGGASSASGHEDFDIKAFQQKKQQAEMTRNRLEEEIRENHPMFDKPLFSVGRESRFRKLCQTVVHARYQPTRTDETGKLIQRKYTEIQNRNFSNFLGLLTYLDWTMVVVTSMSCISMMFETPFPQKRGGEPRLVMHTTYLQIMDYVFVITMTIELIVKVLANGLFFTPKAFIRDVGGVMTAFIYITSLIFLIWMPDHVQPNTMAQLFLVFRAMRPLRIYTLVPHIRRVVVELCKGFKEILLVTVLLILLMFIFASFGVQLVGGQLARCNDVTITKKEDCHGIYEQQLFVTKLQVPGKFDKKMHPTLVVPRIWANPRNFNFDHIGNAMLALFEILSFKGWTVVRDVILDRLGAWPAVFVHIYIFIGCMIGLTLFVGVVIANYTENRGTALLTVDQRRWNDLKSRLKIAQPLHIPPRPPESAKARTFLYDLTTSSAFKRVFAILILLNSTLLCFIPWDISEDRNTLLGLTVTAGLFTIAFTVEIVLKAIAFTPRGFWQSRRNRYDILITTLGLIWLVIHAFAEINCFSTNRCIVPSGTDANQTQREDLATRVRRFSYSFGYFNIILRFFTITGRHATLKMLMLTVAMSMVRSFFIIVGMFLLMLFYAYTGVIIFGTVKYGEAIGRHANFRTATNAMFVLFRIVTGEDWNKIMHDCMRSQPFCIYNPLSTYWKTDCGNYYGAIVYFCTFYLIITYIVLNLLVAIIMENFSLFYSSDEDALLSYADIRNFQTVWNMVDVEQKGSIPVKRVKFLLHLLRGRLEVDPEKDRLVFKHMCYEMERLHNGEDTSFHDVLSMLSYRSVDIRKSLLLEELLMRQELEYIIEEEVAKQTIRTWLEGCLRRIRLEKERAAKGIVERITEAIPNSTAPPIKEEAEEQPNKKSKKQPPRERQSSLAGSVAAAKKLFTPKTEKLEKKSPTAPQPVPTLKRPTLKGTKNLPEVTESNEETPTSEKNDASPSTAAPSGAASPGILAPTHVPDVRDWWK